MHELYLPVYGWLKEMHASSTSATTLIGMQCLQGGGKTTLCDQLELLARHDGLNCVVASIDDFYRTHAELEALARSMPDDPLLHGRGQPGTHDVPLMRATVDGLRALRVGETMRVPRYDKSAHGGLGDRAAEAAWPVIDGPIDVVVLEGWCFGFAAAGARGASPPPPRLRNVDAALADFAPTYAALDAFLVLQALSARYVYEWREDAEAERRATGGGAMSADDVVDFVDRYYPSYEAYLPELYRASPCAEDRTKRVWIGRDRLPSPAPPAGHDVLQ